jgi:hypothetical protein
MATYAGTSIAGTAGVASTSSVAEDAMQSTTSSSGNGLTVSNSGTGYGVYSSSSGSSSLAAVYGTQSNGGAKAVTGINTSASTSGPPIAMYAGASSTAGIALQAVCTAGAGSGTAIGVEGMTAQTQGEGVYGENTASGVSGQAFPVLGVYGYADVYGGCGVLGECGSTGGGVGVWGSSSDPTGYGVWGYNITSSGAIGCYGEGYTYGVYGYSTNGVWAVYASGDAKVTSNLTVVGSITAGTKDFKIDHPLDPANKYLSHSCVESPERKNVYDGVVKADKSGEAVVAMPDYFEALNTEFRYQLTAIGAAAPDLHVKSELKKGSFVIGGARANQKISWQVTGIRQDALAKAKPLVVEQAKPKEQKGLYLHPEAHGQPSEKGIDYHKCRRREPSPRRPRRVSMPTRQRGRRRRNEV